MVFYDDRRFTQPDGDPNDTSDTDLPGPWLDFFYAVSPDGGQHWFEKRLAWTGDPNEPAAAFELNGVRLTIDPADAPDWVAYALTTSEYTSITVAADVCFGSEVWTAFTGTWSGDTDPNNDKAVLWYSRIRYSPDVNGDGIVGLSDLGSLYGYYGATCDDGPGVYEPQLDFDSDCQIGLSDQGIMLAHWGEACALIGGAEQFAPIPATAGGEGAAPQSRAAGAPSLFLDLCDLPAGGDNTTTDCVIDVMLIATADGERWTAAGVDVQTRSGAALVLASSPDDNDPLRTHLQTPRTGATETNAGVYVVGAFEPAEAVAVWTVDAINAVWTAETFNDGDLSGPSRIARLVLDLTHVAGASSARALYFSEVGPANPQDVCVAELNIRTHTTRAINTPHELRGGLYLPGD